MAQVQGGQPIIILREGTTQTRGREALGNNIAAAKAVANAVRSTLGPLGMDKMLVSGIGDIVITNDGATIVDEMDIEHPAAKMMVEIAKTQDQEAGDGTTTAVVLAAELLTRAEALVGDEVHPTRDRGRIPARGRPRRRAPARASPARSPVRHGPALPDRDDRDDRQGRRGRHGPVRSDGRKGRRDGRRRGRDRRPRERQGREEGRRLLRRLGPGRGRGAREGAGPPGDAEAGRERACPAAQHPDRVQEDRVEGDDQRSRRRARSRRSWTPTSA